MAYGRNLVSYKAECEARLQLEEEEITIGPECIKNFATDYKFEKNNLPIVWLIMDVTNELYDKIIDNQADAHMYIRVKNFDGAQNNALHLDVIHDTFTYFVPTQYSKSTEVSSTDPSVQKARHRHIVLGLLQDKMLNKYKTSFNAVYPETSTTEMIETILEGIPESLDSELIMDEIQVETDFPSFTMPPQDSVKNALDYLFEREPFYETNYQFFIDFDKIYLLDSTGKKREVSAMNTVLITIVDIADKESYYEGCIKDGESGTYIIYANTTDISFHIDGTREKNTNKLFGYQTGEVTVADLEITGKKVTDPKVRYDRFSGEGLTTVHEQVLADAIVTMELTRMNIDSSQITPDKCYIIDDPRYSQYNGKYLLVSKSEVLSKTDWAFNTTTTMLFKRIASQDEE